MTQRQIAMELNVPSQYLSDVRCERRPLTDQFARRFAEVYHISATWLLDGYGPMELADLAAIPSTVTTIVLPVLAAPWRETRESPHWDGSMITVAGAAAVAAQRARQPFVLRLNEDDRSGRLRRNDLLLCSQEPRPDAAIGILFAQERVSLGTTGPRGPFRGVGSGKAIRDAEIIGHVVGVVWAVL